jgi:hypothetical protein
MKSKNVKGFRIELDRTKAFGGSDSDGGKWTMVCVSHGYLLQDTNKARLWSHADGVEEWCKIHNQVSVR